MIYKSWKFSCALGIGMAVFTSVLNAQSLDANNAETSTAILDTSIPFAVGAREGEQSIRGSFGWPTFQEGFVDGVYFRFDPDGYARFSKSTRLDEDVFEVICQQASTVCTAQKAGFEISLTPQGQVALRIAGVNEQDTFFLSNRKSELQLPNTLMQPLDPNLESTLSLGGELIVRRQLETLQNFSLSGFLATVTYLRWVAQNQSSFVFPREWPVPSHTNQPISNQQTGFGTNGGGNQFQRGLAGNGNLQRRGNFEISPQYENNQDPDIGLFQNGFAQQAQGRSLTADVNKFTNAVAENQSHHIPVNPIGYNQKSNDAYMTSIINQLTLMQSQLNDLTHKLDSLFISSGSNNGQMISMNKDHQVDTKLENINLDNPSSILSEQDKIRQMVIESLLTQSQTNETDPQVKTADGEIAVKKTIVERLLEELQTTNETAIPETVENDEKNDDDGFVSLSDYINKIVQEEQQ